VIAVEGLLEEVERLVQRLAREKRRMRGAARLHARERRGELLALLADVVGMLVVELAHALQQFGKRRHAVARGAREIRAAEERQLVGREEHGERPAAASLREHRLGDLVDLVDVGPLLAVDLDVHEVVVHHPRDGRVLEGFVRHDVAPVARGVADREQDRLAGALRLRERLLAPGMPVHGVVGVLLEVGAGFAGEAVGH